MTAQPSPPQAPFSWPLKSLQWSGIALVSASWLSAGIFGAYILAFYLGALFTRHLDRWNGNLPGLYENNHLTALAVMAAHLATGGVILILGPAQLISSLRRRWPAIHIWLGRIYVFTAAIAGLGGIVFILTAGTVGGVPMNIGFGLYGFLMALAAVQTFRYARKLQFNRHRAWGIRIFALAIGSWLYRMDYGFWLMTMHRLGHTSDFRGPFDIAMAFLFYMPNLLLAELFIRARRLPTNSAFRISSALLLNLATLVVSVGTYYFARYYWGPGIVTGFSAGG